MNSLKTAVVVTILLGVMYGVYTTLTNHPGATQSDSASQWPSVGAQVPGPAGAKSAPTWPPGGGADRLRLPGGQGAGDARRF